jgi:hypothetical protein
MGNVIRALGALLAVLGAAALGFIIITATAWRQTGVLALTAPTWGQALLTLAGAAALVTGGMLLWQASARRRSGAGVL